MKIVTIAELRHFIKDLPDDMEVHSCCSHHDFGTSCDIKTHSYRNEKDIEIEEQYVWIGYFPEKNNDTINDLKQNSGENNVSK